MVQNFSVPNSFVGRELGKSDQVSRSTTTKAVGASGSAAADGPVFAPRYVLRGAKLQGVVPTVGVDWLRVQARPGSSAEAEVVVNRATHLLGAFFGGYQDGAGRHFYRSGRRFESGALLWFEPYEEGQFHICCEIPGSCCASVGTEKLLSIAGALLAEGFRFAKRVDLCMDWKGEGLELVQRMAESADAGEMCGYRVHELRAPRGQGNRLVGHMFTAGVRGHKNGSGKYVRCYDKGLEQGGKVTGLHHRLECQFEGHCAQAVLDVLQNISEGNVGFGVQPVRLGEDGAEVVVVPQTWEEAATAMLLGCIDFRERCRGVSRALVRRRQCGWWAEVIAGVQVRKITGRRQRFTDLESFQRWMRKSVAPSIKSMASRTGEKFVDVFVRLVGDLGGIGESASAAVWQYAERGCLAAGGLALHSGTPLPCSEPGQGGDRGHEPGGVMGSWVQRAWAGG